MANDSNSRVEQAKRVLAAKKELARRKEQQAPAPTPAGLTTGEKVLGTARSGLGGMTLGFADEPGLALSALAAKYGPQSELSKGKSLSDVYGEMRGQYNEQQQQFEQQEPALNIGAGLAGGLATGLLGAGKVMATPFAQAQPIKAAMMTGGASGGVAGAGYAPTMADVPAYAGAGTGLGLVAPVALAGAGKVLSPLAGALKRAITTETPRATAARTVGQFASQDALDPAAVVARMQAMGPEAKLADVAGENLLGAARSVGQLQGPGKEMARKSFESRQSGSTKRLMGSIKKLSGGDTDYFNNMKRIVKDNLEKSAPHYKAAAEQSVEVTDDLAGLMSRPSVKAALTKGARKAADEGVTVPKQIKVGDTINFKTFDYTKRALDDKIGEAVRQGRGDDARVLTQVKRQMLAVADEQIPDYATARQIYSEGAGNQNALQLGTRVLRDDFDEMSDLVSDMSKSERESFVNGALKTIRDKLMTGKEDKNAATKLATQAVRERLKNVFPDDDTYKSFINQLDIEDDFAKTYQTIYGGSQTQPRQIGQQELASATKRGGMGDIEGHDAPGIAMSAIRKFTGAEQIPQPVVDEMQRLLLTPFKDLAKKDLSLLKKHNISIGQVKEIQGLFPAIGGVEAGSLGTSQAAQR